MAQSADHGNDYTTHCKGRPVTSSDQNTHHNGDPQDWSVDSWSRKLDPQQVVYQNRAAVEKAVTKLRSLPPLVTSWEIQNLTEQIAEAQDGKRFLLQGGDCAERLDDCRPENITNRLKILLQMSLVLVHGLQKPVIRVGRFAGQYAKPRSSLTETRTVDGKEITLPSYFGDLVNAENFEPTQREPDPHLMVRGYQHAAMTLNFVRALIDGGFADLHHPEYWDLSFFGAASLSEDARRSYEEMSGELASALRFMENLGEKTVDDLTRVDFFTSHEGLNLLYESSQTRQVPRREGFYDLTTHMPWIGERTRDLDGAHVEFFRGIRNPVGVKVGPNADPEEVACLVRTLNPAGEPGRSVLIARMGAREVSSKLEPILRRVDAEGVPVLWVCDPMHGNTRSTPSGRKTRDVQDIYDELSTTIDIHHRCGTHLGGVHFELTGEDVTECTGGASGVTENDLEHNYSSALDPRLNYAQSLELAFLLAKRLRNQNGSN
ncbi:MAG: 3-deoxy-7-phosphoheptulonate synthase [Phycisphaera sp.]|nr:MAG: 3-deoxy-7-phosphoheptulonate synthase [Phycisphaera sp.]